MIDPKFSRRELTDIILKYEDGWDPPIELDLPEEYYEYVASLTGIDLDKLVLLQEDGDYTGVYKVYSGTVLTHYLKESDKLGVPFFLGDEKQAEKYLDFYNELIQQGFYHPDTVFSIKEHENGLFYLRALMVNLEKSEEGYNGMEDVLNQKMAIHFCLSKKYGFAVSYEEHIDDNWGLDKKGDIFFHDIGISYSYSCKDDEIGYIDEEELFK
jgi:hypothetical protein